MEDVLYDHINMFNFIKEQFTTKLKKKKYCVDVWTESTSRYTRLVA
jgi:hypothetical protein